MSSRNSFVFCCLLIVLLGAYWTIIDPKIQAGNEPADIDTGPTRHQMCQDFVARNPRAEVVYVNEYAADLIVYRYVILEGKDRERLQLVFRMGFAKHDMAVSQRDEQCVVEGDMVDLELTTVSPYIQIKRAKPEAENP